MTSPANIYLVKVNNIEIREKSFKVSSKLKIATTERRHQCRSGVFIVNFEHISYLLSTLSMRLFAGCVLQNRLSKKSENFPGKHKGKS